MFISITPADAKQIFAAELAGIFMESGGERATEPPAICIYGKHRDATCIAYFDSKKHCEDAMGKVLAAMSTGALYVEITADCIRAG